MAIGYHVTEIRREAMTLRLTMAFSDNPRVQPLKDGTVKPQNIELECITLAPSTIFQRNLSYDEFDVSEMSISETLLAKERREQFGEGKWDWSALPVFLSRGHVWNTLYANAASGITGLADLKGKRIGVPDYDMTAALWFRITLKDLYSIEAKDNVWYNGRTKDLSHGGALGLDRAGPVGVTHHWLTADQTLDVMLDRGDIDACTAIRQGSRVTAGDPTVIDRYGGTPVHGNPRLKKLLEDGGREVVYEYHRKTGFFHCNHNVIVQNRILREHPWVALELYNAFQRSKEVAYERARRAQSAYLYFPGKDFQEQATVLGEDPYPIGLRAMGKNIERAIQGSLEQGLLTKPLRLEDIYYRTTLKT
jgi:4,5-dihydroxyphthalate decarboxylase